MTCKKIQYDKIGAAIALGKAKHYRHRNGDRQENRTYFCVQCNAWHLTSMAKDVTHKKSADGNDCWYKNGVLHKEDGPAVKMANGHDIWYKNGLKHRIGGPAILCSNGIRMEGCIERMVPL